MSAKRVEEVYFGSNAKFYEIYFRLERRKFGENELNYLKCKLTLSAFVRISFPAEARIVLSIFVAVPVCRLDTRCAAVCDRD